MGLITGVLLLPLAPVRGVLWVAEQLTEEVNRRYYGEGAIVKELRRVDEARRAGRMDPEEAAAREEELLQRRLAGVGGGLTGSSAHG
jgi:Gas vesicle protein G